MKAAEAPPGRQLQSATTQRARPSGVHEPDRPEPDAKTDRESSLPHSALASVGSPPVPPVASARPTRKSCRDAPPAPASALPPRSPPRLSRSRLPEPHSSVAHRHPPPAPAVPCDPASRWESTADSPAAHTLPVPCTPAKPPINEIATLPRRVPLVLHRPYSKPPAACPRSCPRAPLPPPREHPLAPPAAPRSPPTRSEIHGSLPENRSAPKTLCCRPPAISPSPPSGTSALPARNRTGPSKISPPSTPASSNTLALPPLPRYTTPQLPPPAQALPGYLICRSSCLRLGGQWEHSQDSYGRMANTERLSRFRWVHSDSQA